MQVNYISTVAKKCNCSFNEILEMPFDLVAVCYKEAYLDSVLQTEEGRTKLSQKAMLDNADNGNYGETEMDIDRLEQRFGGAN